MNTTMQEPAANLLPDPEPEPSFAELQPQSATWKNHRHDLRLSKSFHLVYLW